MSYAHEQPAYIKIPGIGGETVLEVSNLDSDGDTEFEVCTDGDAYDMRARSVWLNKAGRQQLREWLDVIDGPADRRVGAGVLAAFDRDRLPAILRRVALNRHDISQAEADMLDRLAAALDTPTPEASR